MTYTGVNETKDSTKSNSSGVVKENNSVANFATSGSYNSFDDNQSQRHSNGRVMNEHEPGWKKKSRSKHDKPRCYVCDSTQHFKKDCTHVKEMTEKIRRLNNNKNAVRDESNNSNTSDEENDGDHRSVSSAGESDVSYQQPSHSSKSKANYFWNRKLKSENPFRENSSRKSRAGQEKDKNKRSRKS